MFDLKYQLKFIDYLCITLVITLIETMANYFIGYKNKNSQHKNKVIFILILSLIVYIFN